MEWVGGEKVRKPFGGQVSGQLGVESEGERAIGNEPGGLAVVTGFL